jgi:hypothetical protein
MHCRVDHTAAGLVHLLDLARLATCGADRAGCHDRIGEPCREPPALPPQGTRPFKGRSGQHRQACSQNGQGNDDGEGKSRCEQP